MCEGHCLVGYLILPFLQSTLILGFSSSGAYAKIRKNKSWPWNLPARRFQCARLVDNM